MENEVLQMIEDNEAKEVATTSLYILKRWELRNNYVIRR